MIKIQKIDKTISVEYIPLRMERPNLDNIPEYTLPEGYAIRLYKKGEEEHWARVETAAGEFETQEAALTYFENQYGDYKDEMEKRCLFLVTEDGQIIGTTTALHAANGDIDLGRIGWVAIDPNWQGMGLSKSLLSQALNILAIFHKRAYLTTQTTSFRAINMYLNYGFLPMLEKDSDIASWRYMESILSRSLNLK